MTTIGGLLDILDNILLTSLSGLDNINGGLISKHFIKGNVLLYECDVQSICDYLLNPGGQTSIHDNAAGCNSYVEVAVAYGYTSLDDYFPEASFSTYPNPTYAYLNIELPVTTPMNSTFLTVYSTSGQQLLHCQMTEFQTVIDISRLPQGLYFVKLASDDRVKVTKIVKE